MALTAGQLAAIKADIAASGDLNTAASDQAVADLYNVIVPTWFAWNPSTPLSAIVDAITWANFTPQDVADTTVQWGNRSLACQGKQLNIQTMLLVSQSPNNSGPVIDATKSNLRAGLQDSLGQLPSGASGASKNAGWTAVQLILSRATTRAEKLLSTGTGSQAVPVTMGFVGPISASDVDAARHS